MPVETQAFIRIAYGILEFLLILIILPFSKVYFTTEKYGGCLHSSSWTDRVFNSKGHIFLMVSWMITAFMIIVGFAPVLFTAINLLFCYLFFVRFRWLSPLRGMGAPGYITYWLAALIFFLEFSLHHGDPDGDLRSLVILAFRIDFAIMMIDSGINKIHHGYARNLGMNYGMANPAWGYWPRLFQKLPPDHLIFKLCNHSAYFFQILGGVLMLIPHTYWLGALTIFGSFLFVKPLIRLGVLCDQLMLMTFLFTQTDGWFHHALLQAFPRISTELIGMQQMSPLIINILTFCLWTYIVLLPLAKLGMHLNFYYRKTFPRFIQKSIEWFSNVFGIILWRVFTIDLIDFFIRVYKEDAKSKERTLITRFGHWSPSKTNRFLWVGESIMSLIVFNTERYFPQTDLFRKRLLLYAGTFHPDENSSIVFEYVILYPSKNSYEYIPTKEYVVNTRKKTIQERILSESGVQLQQSRQHSVVRASTKPGSYAPAADKSS